jgi:hypothetical protein
MTRTVAVATIILLASQVLECQTQSPSTPGEGEHVAGIADSSAHNDSTQTSMPKSVVLLTPPTRRRLLPDNMSFMERGLWGESGFLRGIGIASSPLTPEVRKNELQIRRTMLTMHQVGGFVTLGLMGTAVYYGQRLIDGHRDARDKHQLFVDATIISYGATALLAALSPPPLIRRDETSTTTIHKTLAWVHFGGMILTPILAGMIHRRDFGSSQAHFHQASAYITTAALAASLIVVTF